MITTHQTFTYLGKRPLFFPGLNKEPVINIIDIIINTRFIQSGKKKTAFKNKVFLQILKLLKHKVNVEKYK